MFKKPVQGEGSPLKEVKKFLSYPRVVFQFLPNILVQKEVINLLATSKKCARHLYRYYQFTLSFPWTQLKKYQDMVVDLKQDQKKNLNGEWEWKWIRDYLVIKHLKESVGDSPLVDLGKIALHYINITDF